MIVSGPKGYRGSGSVVGKRGDALVFAVSVQSCPREGIEVTFDEEIVDSVEFEPPISWYREQSASAKRRSLR